MAAIASRLVIGLEPGQPGSGNPFRMTGFGWPAGRTSPWPWRAVSGQLKEGDTAYLVRLGEEPQGLVARGTVTSEPYEDAQYDPDLADKGEKALYVDITLTDLRDPKAEPYISLADLKAGTVDGQDWTPQGSGIEIKPRSAKLVAGLWSKLPPVRVVQANQPTSRQQAIHIGKPVNQIFYGPPGTGKTHHWRNHIQQNTSRRPARFRRASGWKNSWSIPPGGKPLPWHWQIR